MEKSELLICDSDIHIEVLDRNNKEVIDFLVGYGEQNLCICSVTYSEIIFGASSKEHLSKLLPELDKFIFIPINREIDNLQRELILRYTLSHKLRIQDAFIAATAIHFDIPQYSLNKKDFRFIEGLRLL